MRPSGDTDGDETAADRRAGSLPITGALTVGLVTVALHAAVPWRGDPSDAVVMAAVIVLLAGLAGWSFHLRWRALEDRVDRSIRDVMAVIAAGAAGTITAVAGADDPAHAGGVAGLAWTAGQGAAVLLVLLWFPPAGRRRPRIPAGTVRVAAAVAAAALAWLVVRPTVPWHPRQPVDVSELGLAALFLVAAGSVLAGPRGGPDRSETLLGAAALLLAASHGLLAFSRDWLDSPAMWSRALAALALSVPLAGTLRDHVALLHSQTNLSHRYALTQRRIRGLLDALPVLVLSVDAALRVRYSNRAASLITGGPDDGGHEAQPWLDRIHPEDRGAVQSAIRAVSGGGSPGWEGVVRATDRDESLHWLSLQARPMTDPLDAAPLVELVATDVTDLLIARRTSESRQTRLAFLANVAQTLAGETAESRIVDRLLDMGREIFPAVGVTLYRPSGDEHRLRVVAAAGVALEQPSGAAVDTTAAGPRHGAWQAFHEGFPRQSPVAESGARDGDVVRLGAAGCSHVLHLPLLAAGTPTGVASWTLTEPADLATDVIDLLTQLGFLVGGAVYLSQLVRELDEQRAVAMEASRLKSEFLANTSHELRTPLTAILGFLRLILDGSVEDRAKQADFLRIAHESAEKLLTIINDVLDLAKIEAGRLEVHRAPVPMPSVLADVSRLFVHQMRGRGLRFEIEDESGQAVAWADPDRVLQILTNLLSNAIKFTPRGGWVSLRCGTSRDGCVELTVRDSGVGLAEGELDRVFASFYQVDGSSTRQHGGTGLGLTISRRLAELMGGSLSLDSEGPDAGTTATLTLRPYRDDTATTET